MIDIHCHLNFHKFEHDVDAVIHRAFEKGVKKIVNVGTSLESSEHAVRLAEKYENLFAIVGIHPHHADKVVETFIKKLEKIAQHKKVIGIGEIGMDFFSYQSNGIVDPKQQRKVFEQQLELAHRLKLPLQIHNRQAGKDILEILDYHKNSLETVPGMFHCMSGNLDFLKKVLDRGFYVGFDGNITYEGLAPGEDTKLTDLVSYAPLQRIVIETDSPYLTPIPHRGTRNEPQYVILTAHFIAQVKGIPPASVIDQTTENVYTIFTKLK